MTGETEAMLGSDSYDVIVIGGGPAGSCCATLVAQAGHRVLLLERETVPRFKIGESLMPATYWPLRRLGLLTRLGQSHFPKKYSVQFFSRTGKASSPFYFHETNPHESSRTWQVLRSEFDQLLLSNARDAGVEVVCGASVREVIFEGGRAVGVKADLPAGESAVLGSRVVVDASGQGALIARQLGLREIDPCLRHASVFSHFEGAARDPGIDEGATLILHTREGRSWFWFIPLPGDRASVGVVGPVDYLITGRSGDPGQIFAEELALCPALQPRLAEARRAMDFKVLKDFSYRAERIAGDGWVLIGDAFGFLDPIYSTGVMLALESGAMAADAIRDGLASGDLSGRQLGRFEGRFVAGLEALRRFVYAFYTPGFSFSRFLRRHPHYRRQVIDILVGDVFDRDHGDLLAALEEACQAGDEEVALVGEGEG